MRETKLNTKNGITLIALVITIIVMLILVTVTITMAVNGGLFGYAGNAVRDTEIAKQDELKIAEGSLVVDGKPYDSPEDFIAGIESGPEKFSAIYNETAEYKEKINGEEVITAWIPKGFAVGTSEGINKVEEGLVIQDKDGNQFVWIPVHLTGTDEEKSEQFENIRMVNHYDEPLATGAAQWEIDEYAAMKASIVKKGGFYIGRYEAGIQTTENPRTTHLKNLGKNTMVIKRDCFPYNFVGWGASMTDYEGNVTYTSGELTYNLGPGAVGLSRNMYPSNNRDYGAISTLCYGIQWDAMLNFIEKTNENDSSIWGNYTDNEWTVDRQTAKYSEDLGVTWKSISDEEENKKRKDADTAILLTTGASENFKAKNIYDIAGNCIEWTMEASGTTYRVRRGGEYVAQGLWNQAHKRDMVSYPPSHVPNYNAHYISFRPTLYVKL